MGEQDVIIGRNLLEYRRVSNDKEGSFLLLLFLSRAPLTRDPENGGQRPWVLWPMAFYFAKAMRKASKAFCSFWFWHRDEERGNGHVEEDPRASKDIYLFQW